MKYDAYPAIAGRPQTHPQDLAGVLAAVAQYLGVVSEADQPRLPNGAELAFSLQCLIEQGKIAEAGPHRYYDPDGLAAGQNFSGVSCDEYERACAAYFQRLREPKAWNLAGADLPGGEVFSSPDGQHACVLYDWGEIRMCVEAARLALVKGPPEKPMVILRPPSLMCDMSLSRDCVYWLGGSRYCAVRPLLYYGTLESLPLTFLDVVTQSFAHDEISGFTAEKVFDDGKVWLIRSSPGRSKQRQENRIAPAQLAWQSWRYLPDIDKTTESRPPKDRIGAE